ncbi:MAG: sulfotransferase [candidate division KSB1 bacterium]|nr:sulfotransferase [candidate division KSB1 bacterium]
MSRPFIYIAGLRRSGSTVLSEALTLLPHSFIFREPRVAENRFSVHDSDVELFLQYGIDLVDFERRWWRKRKLIPEAFKNELIPRLAALIGQIGVKEIRHDRWRRLFRLFPEMKILLTARDPRDIYISLFYKVKNDHVTWSGLFSAAGEFCPEAVAESLNRQFRQQLAMLDTAECLQIKYEDFCTNPRILEQVKAFVGSAIPRLGEVGAFNAANPMRLGEYELHGRTITGQRIHRWKHEVDDALVAAAQKTFDLMPEYCEFWKYEKQK